MKLSFPHFLIAAQIVLLAEIVFFAFREWLSMKPSPRYVLSLDEERKAAGWGVFYWIVDQWAEGQARFVRLVPEAQAEAALQEANASHHQHPARLQ